MPIGAPDAKLRAAVWRRALPSAADADVDHVLGSRRAAAASIGRAERDGAGRHGARRHVRMEISTRGGARGGRTGSAATTTPLKKLFV